MNGFVAFAPDAVRLRELLNVVCIDEECDLSGGEAHAGPCEPCSCGVVGLLGDPSPHALWECPAGDLPARLSRAKWAAFLRLIEKLPPVRPCLSCGRTVYVGRCCPAPRFDPVPGDRCPRDMSVLERTRTCGCFCCPICGFRTEEANLVACKGHGP